MDESNSNDEYCKFSFTDTHEYRDNKKSVMHYIFAFKLSKQFVYSKK